MASIKERVASLRRQKEEQRRALESEKKASLIRTEEYGKLTLSACEEALQNVESREILKRMNYELLGGKGKLVRISREYDLGRFPSPMSDDYNSDWRRVVADGLFWVAESPNLMKRLTGSDRSATVGMVLFTALEPNPPEVTLYVGTSYYSYVTNLRRLLNNGPIEWHANPDNQSTSGNGDVKGSKITITPRTSKEEINEFLASKFVEYFH